MSSALPSKRRARTRANFSHNLSLLAGAAATALATAAPWAAAHTWDNSSGDALYKTAINWVEDTIPPTQSDPAIFPAGFPGPGGATTVSANIGFAEAQSLSFNDAYTLTGSSQIVLGNGNVAVAAGVTATLLNDINGSNGFHKLGGGTLIFSGPRTSTYLGGCSINLGVLVVDSQGRFGSIGNGVTIGPATLRASTTFGTGRSFTLSSALSTIDVVSGATLTLLDPVGGAGTLNKTGPGTLVLSGANTYSGNTVIEGGAVSVNADARLGNAVSTVRFNGGALATTATFSSPRNMILDAAGGTFNVASGTTFTSSGSIGGTGGLTKTGAGTLVFSGTGNGYGGTTTVNEGTLRLNKSSGHAIPGNLVIGDGVGSDVVISDATEQLFPANLTILSSGVLNLNSFGATVNSVTMTGGQISNGVTLTLSGGFGSGITTLAHAAPAQITANVSFNGQQRSVNVADGAAADDLVINGAVTNGSLVKTGAGNLVLTGGNPNTSLTTTTINAGTLTLQKDAGILAALGNVMVGDGSGTDALRILQSEQVGNTGSFTIASSGTVELGSGVTETITNVTMTGGGQISGAGGILAIQGDVTTNASATPATIAPQVNLSGQRTFTIADGAAASDLTLTGSLASGSLIKAGPGTLTLTAASARTGNTWIQAGTLSIGADNHLGVAGAALDFGLAGGSDTATLATTATFATARPITINAPVVAGFDVGAGTTLTLTGDVFGNGGLRKVGGGTLATTANVTLSGTGGSMTVDGGTVSQSAAVTLLGGPLRVGGAAASNGTYVLGGGTLTVSNNFAAIISEAVGLDGAGTFLQTGGTHNVNGFNSSVVVGQGPSGVGTYTISAGTFNARRLRVGRDAGASGTVNVNGGTIIVANDLQLGLSSGAIGTVNVNSGSVSAPAIYVGGTSGGGGGTGSLNVAGGTATTPGEARIWTTSGGTGIHLSAGILSVGSLQTSGNPQRLTWTGGTLEFTGSNPVIGAADTLGPTVNVAAGMTLRVTGTGEYLRVASGGALNITGGIVDLTDNDLIVDYASGDPSPEFTLRDHVKNIVNGGTSGIAFTVGAGDVAIAVAEKSEWGFSTFNGVTLDDTTVIGKYTYYGDANLDGKVTSDDYVAVDVGLGTGDSWVQGDFNFSGTVTSDDYVAIDVNLGKGTPTPLAFAELKSEMIALHTPRCSAPSTSRSSHTRRQTGSARRLCPNLRGQF